MCSKIIDSCGDIVLIFMRHFHFSSPGPTSNSMRHQSLTSACVFAIVILLTSLGVSAQYKAPLSTVLGPDGSVRPNVAGAFDPSGYRLAYGESGEPKFVSETQSAGTGCSDNWDTAFTLNGADNGVRAVVADGAGNFYIGGWFTSINDLQVSGIAKWDGTSWSALGSGVDGGVMAIAISGTDIYVGGDFMTAGGAPARHVAKWNGSSWSALGSGLGELSFNNVQALAVSGTNVYAGGQFTDAGNLNNIARWDGSSWVSMGTGMNQGVSAMKLRRLPFPARTSTLAAALQSQERYR